jgi:hypothetical protein
MIFFLFGKNMVWIKVRQNIWLWKLLLLLLLI